MWTTILIPTLINAFALIATSLLFLGGLIVLGYVVRVNAFAYGSLMAAWRDSETSKQVLGASREAHDEIRQNREYVPPTDAELDAFVRMPSEPDVEPYPNVDDNAAHMGFEGEPDIPSDQWFVPREEG